MKKMAFLVLVLATISVAAPTAQAGSLSQWLYWFQGDDLLLVQQSNLDLLQDLRRQGQIAGLRSLAEDAIFDGTSYWVPRGRGGYGYPVMDRYGRPQGRSSNLEDYFALGLGGAAIGGAVGGNKGALIVGGGGLLGAWIYHKIRDRGGRTPVYVSEPEVLPVPERAPAPRPSHGMRERSADWGGEEVEIATPRRRTSERPYFGGPSRGQFELANNTPFFIDVFDGERFVGRMRPGQILRVGPPEDRYWAQALVPGANGALLEGRVESTPRNTGWGFETPAHLRGRRG